MSGTELFALCLASFAWGAFAALRAVSWATRKGYTIYELKKKDGEK